MEGSTPITTYPGDLIRRRCALCRDVGLYNEWGKCIGCRRYQQESQAEEARQIERFRVLGDPLIAEQIAASMGCDFTLGRALYEAGISPPSPPVARPSS